MDIKYIGADEVSEKLKMKPRPMVSATYTMNTSRYITVADSTEPASPRFR